MEAVRAVQGTPRNVSDLDNKFTLGDMERRTSIRSHTTQKKFIAAVVSSETNGEFEFVIKHNKHNPPGKQFSVTLIPKDESTLDPERLLKIEQEIKKKTGAAVITQLKEDSDLINSQVDVSTDTTDYPYPHTHPELIEVHNKLLKMGDEELLALLRMARKGKTSPDVAETLICNLPLIQKGLRALIKKIDRLESKPAREIRTSREKRASA